MTQDERNAFDLILFDLICPQLVLGEKLDSTCSRSPSATSHSHYLFFLLSLLSPLFSLARQEQESDDDDDTATTSHMTDAAAPEDGAKKDKKAAPRAALDAMLAGEAAINPQVSTPPREVLSVI